MQNSAFILNRTDEVQHRQVFVAYKLICMLLSNQISGHKYTKQIHMKQPCVHLVIGAAFVHEKVKKYNAAQLWIFAVDVCYDPYCRLVMYMNFSLMSIEG